MTLRSRLNADMRSSKVISHKEEQPSRLLLFLFLNTESLSPFQKFTLGKLLFYLR